MNIFFCVSFSVESIFHRRQDNAKNSTSGHSSVGLTAGMQDIRSANIQTYLSQWPKLIWYIYSSPVVELINHHTFTFVWNCASSHRPVITSAEKLMSDWCLYFPFKAFDSRYWWHKCESQLVGTSLIILVVTQMNKERLDTGFCHRLIHSHTRVSSSDYVPTGMYSTENRHCVGSISVGTCWAEVSVKQRLSIW